MRQRVDVNKEGNKAGGFPMCPEGPNWSCKWTKQSECEATVCRQTAQPKAGRRGGGCCFLAPVNVRIKAQC